MQTNDLISLIAAGAAPVDTGRLGRLTWLAALLALVAAAGLVLLTLGARPDLAGAWFTPPVLGKLLLGTSVAAITLTLFQSSLRPGLSPQRRVPFVALPVAVILLWAVLVLAGAPRGDWGALTFGRSWLACLVAVPLFGLAPFAALVAVARQGAPTRPRLTGALAGLAAAALATVAYSMHCPEDTVPFIASWYPLAMLAMTALGALLVPRFTRW